MIRESPNYCPQCGTALDVTVVDGRQRNYCPGCDQIVWRDPAPCAAVVVQDGDEILLERRAIEPKKGKWGLPGGHLEYDEHPRRAAARELTEETGIEVDHRDLAFHDIDVHESTPGKHVLLIVYAVPLGDTDGTLRPSEESSAVRFWSPAEIGSRLSEIHSNHRAVLAPIGDLPEPR